MKLDEELTRIAAQVKNGILALNSTKAQIPPEDKS